MKNKIRQILREEINKILYEISEDWNSLDDVIKVDKKDLKKYIIHSTTVDPKILYNEGIEPRCAKDSKEWFSYNYPCVVFAINNYREVWWSEETLGGVVIDTSKLSNEWWYDPILYDTRFKGAILTNERIPAEAIVGVLCEKDIMDLIDYSGQHKNDEDVVEYIKELMRINSEEWSNNCVNKTEYYSENKYLHISTLFNKDYKWYYDTPEQRFDYVPDSVWLINPKKKNWVLGLRKDGLLWLNYDSYFLFEEYLSVRYFDFSMKRSDYKNFIKIWVEDVLNRKVDSIEGVSGDYNWLMEDILKNGKQLK